MDSPNILVINCGSSSLKFAVIWPVSGKVLSHGLAERLGTPEARLVWTALGGEKHTTVLPRADHGRALDAILDQLTGVEIGAVGHRVVHGGEQFSDSVRIDDRTLAAIEACNELAPLHNPANVTGIRAAMARFPHLPHVAVFDTAFHQTMPSQAFLYGIPYALYEEHRIRRYGFHGTSHRYMVGEAATRLGRLPTELQLVTAHLGNGCSACAVKHGQSVDTTMGFTPLEGLVMGTRSGDVDPNLHQFLAEHTGRTLAEITDMLNRQSGLLGISGLSNDMRTLVAAAEQGDTRASLAIEVFCYRLAKSILGLCAGLDRLDALVFTGGIGENSTPVRARTLAHLGILGAELDPTLNQSPGSTSTGAITTAKSRLLILVVPTNEELVIAREADRLRLDHS
ncbi:MAG: acetate kinase [Verrucomicrobium sp.]